jgi:hypothetical protein
MIVGTMSIGEAVFHVAGSFGCRSSGLAGRSVEGDVDLPALTTS